VSWRDWRESSQSCTLARKFSLEEGRIDFIDPGLQTALFAGSFLAFTMIASLPCCISA
jgi:hypothetical protein